MSDIARDLVNAVTQHIPGDVAWVPLLGAAVVTLLGLLLLARGARLAPALVATVFLAGGALGGSHLSAWWSTPLWPTVAGAGVLACVAGLFFVRIWLALMLAACLIAGSLTFYGTTALAPHLARYESRGLDAQGMNTLPTPAQIADAAPRTAATELAQLWSYLSDNVPRFQTGFWTIVASACAAGLALGLLVPRLSRALWASTLGVGLLSTGLFLLLQRFTPEGLNWLQSQGTWVWGALGGVWLASLAFNLFDSRPRKVAAPAKPEAAKAAA